ncbi:pentapeptide repeat-containing protein [Actinomadura scrupuli]|uniref:pentapeptide repeat-containing protein n=1 Tax=Actinomadura scrupuli TaxID=559629 RepID=UPI003D976231
MDAYQELSELPFATALVPHDGSWSPDETYDGVHVDGGTLTAAGAVGSRFIECAFTRVTFDGGSFRRSRLSEVWSREVRLVATDLAESDWLDAAFVSTVVAGAQAYNARLRRVTFRGCKIDSVNFRSAGLIDVVFDDCLLRDVDFSGANLERTRFPGSRLSGVDFTKATLKKVDLRGAQLEISGGYESLRGAIIDTTQLIDLAPTFAQVLGITVKDV